MNGRCGRTGGQVADVFLSFGGRIWVGVEAETFAQLQQMTNAADLF